MGSPANWITLLLVSACTLMVHGQENAQTRIPDSLIECYRNQTLRHPENRPPMTIQTFIDIVSKVERFQRGTVDIADLTTAILHSFRLDGIERSPGVVEGPGVLPFAVRGNPFYKHRIILRYLVPSNNYVFPSESLSQIELCTLHFMLSHTIDTTRRGDESVVCARLSNYELGNRVPRHVRFRRQVEEEEAAAKAAEEQKSEEQKSEEGNSDLTKDAEQIPPGDTEKGLQGSDENSENTPQHVPDTDESKESAQEGDKSDTTLKKEAEVMNQTANGNGTKSGKFIFDDDLPYHHFPHQKARNVVDPETDTDTDTDTGGDTDTDPEVEPRQTVNPTESECPVEGGVVFTRSGAVSLGTVLAGIGAGLFPQEVPMADLVRRTPPIVTLPEDLTGATVDNRFTATLVGDLAEAALVQGPTRLDNIRIGLAGGWNSTIAPRWYFNRERDGRELTDAEIRGGLDGLVMGTYIADWRRQLSGTELRLSQLLSMYYSEDGAFSSQNRSCQRRDLYSAVAPNAVLEEQTYRFAVVLDHHSFTAASIASAQLRTFGATAVRGLSSYLPGMDDRSCFLRPNDLRRMTMFTNVTVIIDRNWPFDDIRDLLYLLAGELELSEFGSRLTVLNGRNGAAFITDAMFQLDIAMNFTRPNYETHEAGMDIPRALEQELQRNMEDLLNAESANGLAGGRSTVILFIPHTPVTLNNNDLTIARDRVNHFRNFLPDVRFLYLAPGSRDLYRELVLNPATDIFTFVSLTTDSDKIYAINQVSDRIKEVPLRLMNPTCGANWTGTNYVNADFIHSVKQLGVKYHRLHPNYFFDAGSALITVTGFGSPEVTVCHSRTHEFPDNVTSGTSDVTCSTPQSGNVEIRLENPCAGSEFISHCRPLFISVSSTPITPSGPLLTAGCARDCVFPTNVQYTIRNQGLRCTAGVGHLLSNPQFIFLTAALILLMKYLKVGS